MESYNLQGRHGKILEGKNAIVAATSPAPRRRRFLFLKIQPRTKTLAALPPVAALIYMLDTYKLKTGPCTMTKQHGTNFELLTAVK